MVTTSYGTLTSSLLALIGISSGTMLGSTIIDYSKKNDTYNQLKALQLDDAKLQTEINHLNNTINTRPTP